MAHTRGDACCHRAVFKYSNSIRGDTDGPIRADEPRSPVLFLILLLIAAISGCVGVMVPDNSPLKRAHLPCLCCRVMFPPRVSLRVHNGLLMCSNAVSQMPYNVQQMIGFHPQANVSWLMSSKGVYNHPFYGQLTYFDANGHCVFAASQRLLQVF